MTFGSHEEENLLNTFTAAKLSRETWGVLTLQSTKNESTLLSNGPLFPKEHCFLEGSQASHICLGKMKMIMEQWWNNTDRTYQVTVI